MDSVHDYVYLTQKEIKCVIVSYENKTKRAKLCELTETKYTLAGTYSIESGALLKGCF